MENKFPSKAANCRKHFLFWKVENIESVVFRNWFSFLGASSTGCIVHDWAETKRREDINTHVRTQPSELASNFQMKTIKMAHFYMFHFCCSQPTVQPATWTEQHMCARAYCTGLQRKYKQLCSSSYIRIRIFIDVLYTLYYIWYKIVHVVHALVLVYRAFAVSW